VAVHDLHRRPAGEVRRVEVVELLAAQVEPDVLEQVDREPLLQLTVRDVAHHAPELASPSETCVSTVAVCRQNRGSRPRSRNLVVPGMPTSHSSPSNTRGSIGLIRG
jgi:hypothetical protein